MEVPSRCHSHPQGSDPSSSSNRSLYQDEFKQDQQQQQQQQQGSGASSSSGGRLGAHELPAPRHTCCAAARQHSIPLASSADVTRPYDTTARRRVVHTAPRPSSTRVSGGVLEDGEVEAAVEGLLIHVAVGELRADIGRQISDGRQVQRRAARSARPAGTVAAAGSAETAGTARTGARASALTAGRTSARRTTLRQGGRRHEEEHAREDECFVCRHIWYRAYRLSKQFSDG
ncbi:unnamed protein product [Closterium sp. NIES-54]